MEIKMSSNEMIIMGVVFATLLFGIIMLRAALHYLDKAKRFAGQIEKFQVQIADLEREIEEIYECDVPLDELGECDAELKKLRQKIDAYDETFGKNIKSIIEARDKEIERLKDELKQRDESVQKPSKKKSK